MQRGGAHFHCQSAGIVLCLKLLHQPSQRQRTLARELVISKEAAQERRAD